MIIINNEWSSYKYRGIRDWALKISLWLKGTCTFYFKGREEKIQKEETRKKKRREKFHTVPHKEMIQVAGD